MESREATTTGCTLTGELFCFAARMCRSFPCFLRVPSFSSMNLRFRRVFFTVQYCVLLGCHASRTCTYPQQQRRGVARERAPSRALPFLRGALNEEPRGPHDLWGACLREIVVHCVRAVSGLTAVLVMPLSIRAAAREGVHKLDARRERIPAGSRAVRSLPQLHGVTLNPVVSHRLWCSDFACLLGV